jgi:hypothetical protein
MKRTKKVIIFLNFIGPEIRRWATLCKVQQSTFCSLPLLGRRIRLRCSFQRAPEAFPYLAVGAVLKGAELIHCCSIHTNKNVPLFWGLFKNPPKETTSWWQSVLLLSCPGKNQTIFPTCLVCVCVLSQVIFLLSNEQPLSVLGYPLGVTFYFGFLRNPSATSPCLLFHWIYRVCISSLSIVDIFCFVSCRLIS